MILNITVFRGNTMIRNTKADTFVVTTEDGSYGIVEPMSSTGMRKRLKSTNAEANSLRQTAGNR